jgi:hypothetical protein
MNRVGFLLASALLATSCYSPAAPEGQGLFCKIAGPNDPDPDAAPCPEGQKCSGGRCVKDSSGGGSATVDIPKTGMYNGIKNDPRLNSATDCPDTRLEPNDSIDRALQAPDPTPDGMVPKIVMMSICPAGKKDVDWFLVDLTDTTKFPQSTLSMLAQIFYDVSYGDLDVGIFDANGRLLASDGSAISNGCASFSVNPGAKYYVAVAGANLTDVNRYDLHIRTFTASRTCTTAPTPTDGGM